MSPGVKYGWILVILSKKRLMIEHIKLRGEEVRQIL